MPGKASVSRPNRSATWFGAPTPIVSAIAISNGAAWATLSATSSTFAGATSPSNGQPNAAETVTCGLMPAAWAAAAISSQALMDSSVVTP